MCVSVCVEAILFLNMSKTMFLLANHILSVNESHRKTHIPKHTTMILLMSMFDIVILSFFSDHVLLYKYSPCTVVKPEYF